MSFNKILNKYRKPACSERDKSTRLELLRSRFLLTDVTDSDRFKNNYQTHRYYKNIAHAKN